MTEEEFPQSVKPSVGGSGSAHKAACRTVAWMTDIREVVCYYVKVLGFNILEKYRNQLK